MILLRHLLLALCLPAVACNPGLEGDSQWRDASQNQNQNQGTDVGRDAAVGRDAGVSVDAGSGVDSGSAADAGSGVDSGIAADAGSVSRDGGLDGGADGGTPISGYHPCPTNGDPCRILPLGDSITWGYTYTGGYRVKLFANTVAANQKVTFTGSLTFGPDEVSGVAFPKHNEGHGGWRIAQITPLIPSPALDASSGGVPHIVLLHIGTNDTCCTGVTNMIDNLGALIDKITSAAPKALLVVAKITPMADPGYASVVKPYNAAIPGAVSARASAGKHVVLVDMNTGFPMSLLLPDGVHPTQAGYELMADRWYAAIGNLLPK